jgi:thiaminase/transcriptional activator TenA
MSFTQEMRNTTWDTWHASMTHPFLEQVVTSELPHASFLFYLHQDAWFLREEAKVLTIAASRAPDLATCAGLAELVTSVNTAEQTRHRDMAKRLGGPIDDAAFAPAPTAYAYVAHMRSVALDGTLAEILAALLPCPWLYRNFGQHYHDREPADPIYREWLAAYQSPALDERVAYQCRLLDETVAAADDSVRARAARAFEISIRYEHAFWDMALKREGWSSGA